MSAPVTPLEGLRPQSAAPPRESQPPDHAAVVAGKPENGVDPETVVAAIASVGELTTSGGRSISFRYDDKAGRVIARVVSDETGEVIRQIPPQEYLDFVAKFREMVGVLFDAKL
jgi:flagellar protein FlaG